MATAAAAAAATAAVPAFATSSATRALSAFVSRGCVALCPAAFASCAETTNVLSTASRRPVAFECFALASAESLADPRCVVFFSSPTSSSSEVLGDSGGVACLACSSVTLCLAAFGFWTALTKSLSTPSRCPEVFGCFALTSSESLADPGCLCSSCPPMSSSEPSGDSGGVARFAFD